MKHWLTALFLFVCVVTYSQNYSFRLNGNTIDPKEDYKVQLRNASLNASVSNDRYCMLQFYSVPTEDEKNLLVAQGVTFINFIQETTFYVYLANGLELGSIGEKLIRSIIPIKPVYKVDAAIKSGKIPDYAYIGSDLIKVNISYFYLPDSIALAKDLYQLEVASYRKYNIGNLIYAEIPVVNISKLSDLNWVKNIQLEVPPAEIGNVEAANVERANILTSSKRGLGYSLTGKGVRIGVWDTDVENHTDFADRVTQREYEYHSHTHGTHVTGTIAGAGLIDPKGKGVAPEALIYSYNFNKHANKLSVAEERFYSLQHDSIEITSNSWGVKIYDCPNHISYSAADMYDDIIAKNFPYFLFVFSSGNDQSLCSDGYNTTTKNLKNSLVVAAGSRYDTITTFSSCGPTNDGRLLPNITANGYSLYSTVFDNQYGYMSGTSMATPAVTGVMSLLYQRYKETHGGERPLSSMMRALACNTATDLGNPGPDYRYGYGMINGNRAIEVLENGYYYSDIISQSVIRKQTITVPEDAVALKVMLAWTDSAAYYGVDKTLVNDLDLLVKKGGVGYTPWVLDPEYPEKNAVQKKDKLNNMEQVTIENPVAGNYSISVQGYSVPGITQEFSVVYDVVMPYLQLTSPVDNEILEPGTEFVIRWDCQGYDKPFDIELSEDNGVTYEVVASGIDPAKRYYAFEFPIGSRVAQGRFRISNGTVFDETKEAFTVMSSPQYLQAHLMDSTLFSSYKLSWNGASNASYEILKLNYQNFEHYAYTNDTTFTLSGLDSDNRNSYFSVRALDIETNAKSERTYAVQAKVLTTGLELPFYEDFESQKSSCFTFLPGHTESLITYSIEGKGYGVILSGLFDYREWIDTSVDSIFQKNKAFVSKAIMSPLEIVSKEDEPIMLSFDLRQQSSEKNTAFLRVRINGKYLAYDSGKTVTFYGDSISLAHYNFEISDYIEKDQLQVEFESVCKVSYNRGGATETGDFFFIDNVSVVKPEKPLLIEKVALVDDSSVSVTLNNVSGIDINGVQAWLMLDSDRSDKIVIAQTLNSATSQQIVLDLPAQLEKNTVYNLSCFVLADVHGYADTVSYQTQIVMDSTLRMGEVSEVVVTDSLLFTDTGGLLYDFSTGENSYLTFYPASNSATVSIRFSNVELNDKSGYIYVYSGDSENKKLLQMITSMDSELEFVSEACSGILTIRFFSNSGKPGPGWKAMVYTKEKQADIIQLDSVKVINDTIMSYITNCGCNTFNTYAINYKLNNFAPFKDSLLRVVAPLQTVCDTLNEVVDQTSDKVDTLYTWANISDSSYDNSSSVRLLIENGSSEHNGAYTKEDCLVNTMTILPRRDKKAEVMCTIYNTSDIPVSGLTVGYSVNLSDTITHIITDTIAPKSTYNYKFMELMDVGDSAIYYVVYTYVKSKDFTRSLRDTVKLYEAESTNRVIEFKPSCIRSVRTLVKPEINLSNDFTFECWAKTEKVTSFGYFFYNPNVYLGYNTQSYMGSKENTIVLGVKVDGEWSKMYVADALQIGAWNHIALVASGTSYKLYIDGRPHEFKLTDNSLNPIVWEPEKWISFGATWHGNSSIQGCLDEIRLWNYCRTPDQIEGNMLTDFTNNTDGLMVYYPIKAAAGRYVYDYSVNDNTAVLYDYMGYNKPKTRPEIKLGFERVWIDNEQFKTDYSLSDSLYILYSKDADLTHKVLNFVSDMKSEITVDGVTQTSGVTANNFSEVSLRYSVKGVGINNGIVNNYDIAIKHLNDSCELHSVMFLPEDNSAISDSIILTKNGNGFYANLNETIDISSLIGRFQLSEGATFSIDDKDYNATNLDTIDFTKPVLVKVFSQKKKKAKLYSIFLDQRNSEAKLLNMVIPNYQIASPIFKDNLAVLWLKSTAKKKCLAPKFWVSDKATVYVDGIRQRSGITANDYTDEVLYTVVSEDETVENNWIVTASVDNINPEITLLGSDTIWVTKGEEYTDPGAEAMDNFDGDITSRLTVSGISNVTKNKVGTYTIVYEVTDRAGNTSEKSRSVIIRDASSVEQLAWTSDSKIYSVGKVLFVELSSLAGASNLSILNSQGRVVQNDIELKQGLNIIPVKLCNGVYIISLNMETGVVNTKVIFQ